VVGDRRIGKSSLLYHISNPEVRARFLDDSASFVFAFIDLQQKRRLTPAEFFGELLSLIAREIADRSVIDLDFSYDSVRGLLERFWREERKLVVLLDEFDTITTNRAFDLEFYSFLRSIANNYDVAFVTSSARDLQELCRSQFIADSPFFNIFTNVFLRPFTHAESMDLIAGPSADAGLNLEGYSRRIIEVAGNFPYFIQIACSAYFEHLWENQGKLNREEVEATFLDEAKGQFRFMWDHMGDPYRRCIRRFVENGRIEKEEEHIYQDLKRSGYFLEDDRGPRLFSSLFSSVISRPKIITTELRDSDLAAMAIRETTAERLTPTPLIEPDGYIDRFTIRRSLGSGGMGDIFQGYDTELRRTVAIKVLASKYVEDDPMKRRFLREARMASQLNHPNIATIYEIGEAAGNPYIVMEYVEGETLASRISKGPLPIEFILEVGQQTAEALAEAHDSHVVHRDIKSANIMITGRGRVKVLDFGLAKPLRLFEPSTGGTADAAGENLTESGILLGTINYMSPEQAGGQNVTHLSDLFSLGVVLYEATTGRLPFDGDTYFQTIDALTHLDPPQVVKSRPDAPPELIAIIERLLKKTPADRYPSAEAVARDLAAILNKDAHL